MNVGAWKCQVKLCLVGLTPKWTRGGWQGRTTLSTPHRDRTLRPYRLSQQLDAAPVRPADVYHNVIRVFGDVESPARAKITRRHASIQYTLIKCGVLTVDHRLFVLVLASQPAIVQVHSRSYPVACPCLTQAAIPKPLSCSPFNLIRRFQPLAPIVIYEPLCSFMWRMLLLKLAVAEWHRMPPSLTMLVLVMRVRHSTTTFTDR